MNGGLSRQRSAVFQAFAVKCQIVDKLLDMAAGDLVKSQMSDRRIHPHRELFHTLIGRISEVELCILGLCYNILIPPKYGVWEAI